MPGGLGAPSFVIVANTKAIDKLTPQNKAALMKAGGEAGSALIGKAWEAADEHGRNDAKERDQTIETIGAGGVREMAAAAAGGDRRVDQEGQAEGL